MAEEGVHEIQLNGKQLVFLFMAATVVAVVIFLCGVMVGRGVRAPGARLAAAADSVVDPTASVRSSSPPTITADRVPVSAQEALTYAQRLDSSVPPPETFREEPVIPPSEPILEPSAEDVRAASDPAMMPAGAAPASDPLLAEPPGSGFVIQVGAYPRRETAEAIARGLAARGYPTFITPRGSLFAVRVGKYSDRREADAVAARLERDEQFNNPWVTH